jgi:hypothetical protein
MAERRPPRFNHVAMSLPAEALDETSRRDIVAFYDEVFGWNELPTMTEDRKRLVLQAYRLDQFVFLIAEDEPMTCARLDHFGMSVSSMDELDEILERAKRYREKDDRVDIIDKGLDDHDVVKIHNCYIGYLLPMMVEVQFFEVDEARAGS